MHGGREGVGLAPDGHYLLLRLLVSHGVVISEARRKREKGTHTTQTHTRRASGFLWCVKKEEELFYS